MATTIDNDRIAREILGRAIIDGNVLRLPEQLSRPEYLAVKKALDAMGSTWNRKLDGHLFPHNPADVVAAFVGGGSRPKPARTAEGYIATPAVLAAQLVRDFVDLDILGSSATVLEPSAGDGALVRAIVDAAPDLRVVAVEPNLDRLHQIDEAPLVERVHDTFEGFASTTTETFELIVMNPPFAVPKRPTIWIDHVHLAYGLLRPGGRVVSIAPVGLFERSDRKHAEVRELVDTHGGAMRLPADAFKVSGTSVRTAVLWIDK